MGPDLAQVRPSACKGEQGGAYPATFACGKGPHEIRKTFGKATPYLYWSLQIVGSSMHAEDWGGETKKENAAAPAVSLTLWALHKTSFKATMQPPIPDFTECFLLQIQLTIQVSSSWRSKQAIKPLLCAAVFSGVSKIAVICFSFDCLSISILLQLFSGEKKMRDLFRF